MGQARTSCLAVDRPSEVRVGRWRAQLRRGPYFRAAGLAAIATGVALVLVGRFRLTRMLHDAPIPAARPALFGQSGRVNDDPPDLLEVVPTEPDSHPPARWRSRRKVTGVARAALAGLVVGFAISVLIAGVEDRHTRGDLAVCRAFAELAPFGPRPTPAQAQRALDDARSAHPRDQELARIAERTFRIEGQLAFRPADVDYLRSVCHALGVGLALGS